MKGSAALKVSPRFTVEEYLEGEEDSDIRHEYVGGDIRAMAGASKRHERVAGRLYIDLAAHLGNGPCEVFKGDMKVKFQLLEQDIFFYPDVVVTCDARDFKDETAHYVEHPKLVIEVLSRNEQRDRVEKLMMYQAVESLEEYAVVSQNPAKPEVRVFRKKAKGGWEPEEVFTEGEFTLRSAGYTGRVEELYEWAKG